MFMHSDGVLALLDGVQSRILDGREGTLFRRLERTSARAMMGCDDGTENFYFFATGRRLQLEILLLCRTTHY